MPDNSRLPNVVDPDKTYRVQLLKSVPFGGATLLAGIDNEMNGTVLADILAGEHKDSVYGAEEITGTVPAN